MELNFIFPYKDLRLGEPPHPFMMGPATCELVNNFSVTFDFEIKKNYINYLVIETFQKFKLAINILNEGFNGVDLKKFAIDNNIKLLICSIADPSHREQKDDIIKTVEKYNISDITYFLETNFTHQYDKNTICVHFFLEDISLNMNTIYTNQVNELGYIAEPIEENELDNFREKKFLCFNRTVDRKHRTSLLYDYIKNDFTDSYFSFIIYNSEWENIFQIPNGDYNPKEYQKYTPIELDTHLVKEKHCFTTTDALKKDFFLNSCINLVTETTFVDNELFISEKILKPLLGYQPFIVFGPYNYLKELKTYGFKTFSDFWDESYDEILNASERYKAIMNIVFELNSKTIYELNDLYQKTKNICIYNRKILNNIVPSFTKKINNLKYEK